MREIKLTKGYTSIIDDEDFDRVSKYKWFAQEMPLGTYAAHDFRGSNRCGKYTYLHMFIMGDVPKGMVIDHINHNKLDNRKSNLRFVPHFVNTKNKSIDKKNKFGVEGIKCNKYKTRTGIIQLYVGRVRFNKKTHYTKSVRSLEEAITLKNELQTKLYKEYGL